MKDNLVFTCGMKVRTPGDNVILDALSTEAERGCSHSGQRTPRRARNRAVGAQRFQVRNNINNSISIQDSLRPQSAVVKPSCTGNRATTYAVRIDEKERGLARGIFTWADPVDQVMVVHAGVEDSELSVVTLEHVDPHPARLSPI